MKNDIFGGGKGFDDPSVQYERIPLRSAMDQDSR